MEAQLLTRETKVREQSVTVFSIDGQRWDSDLQHLRAWHSRGPEWSWGDHRSATRGNRRSARARRKKPRKERTAERWIDDESPPVVDSELLKLAAMMPV